jgi:hypothetical protein
MNRYLLPKTIYLMCIWMLAFAPAVRSQDKIDGDQQAPDRSAKPQAKDKEADEPGASNATQELQKATQNPIASLISVPIQNNSNFGVNPGDRTQDVLNIQPVMPIGISKNWTLIIRWIAPIVWQPVPSAPGTPEIGQYGLGDIQPTFFLSPAKPGKLIWGVGSIIQLPTATNTFLG